MRPLATIRFELPASHRPRERALDPPFGRFRAVVVHVAQHNGEPGHCRGLSDA
jgi:hypothetical protein